MSSSAFEPQETPRENDSREEQAAIPDAGVESNRGFRRDLFEQVMRETQEICDEGATIDSAEKETILSVVRKLQGRPFSLYPVLSDLVHAVLCSRLPERAGSSDAWREISTEIAETLFEDPVASKRLEKFWGRLMDSHLAVGDGQ